MLPPGAASGAGGQLPQLNFPFQPRAHFASLEAIAASSLVRTVVLRCRGRTILSSSCAVKGKQRAESNPNTTAGGEHFNKQRRWTKYH